MLYDETREFWGTVATRGWRNYLTWGGATILLLLGLGFVVRFWNGDISAQDFIALAGVVGPLLYQLYCRHAEKLAGRADLPSSGLVNQAAIS